MNTLNFRNPRARTKIVATVGPACRQPDRLRQLIAAGTDLIRLNTAHGEFDEFDRLIRDVRQLEHEFGPLGVLLDLAGPKIRLGTLAADPLRCEEGATFRLVRGDQARRPDELTCNYPQLIQELEPGNRVVLADGSVVLEVVACERDEVTCIARSTGDVRSRQGLNLPGAKLALPSLTEQDREWVRWSAGQSIDYFSLSFVRRASDILELRELLRRYRAHTPIVAKIEKPEALSELDAIVQAADAVMVARGDLGVEIDIAEVPVAQKRIVAACNHRQKPVIVATQMLDSMERSPRPTRAESSDVANAILDGADACMLSGETAIGEYPIESVRMMNRIMLATEDLLRDRPPRTRPIAEAHGGSHPISHAVVSAAGMVANQIGARLVVTATRSGATALTKSSLRDFVPTVAVSQDATILRRMSLYWGIIPLEGAPLHDRQELRDFVGAWGKRVQGLEPGDLVLLVSGTQLFPDALNQLVVFQVDD